jgi:Protein of unknown function (DUF3311)
MSQPTARPPKVPCERPGLRVSPWNLLLLVPLLALVTPWFNSAGPRLFGLPFFYWFQFIWVAVGMICVAIVYVMTRDRVPRPGSDQVEAAEPGEGSLP